MRVGEGRENALDDVPGRRIRQAYAARRTEAHHPRQRYARNIVEYQGSEAGILEERPNLDDAIVV